MSNLADLLAQFKGLGGGENMTPDTSLQTVPPVDPNAPMDNPPVPATFGDETIPLAPKPTGIPLPQTSDTITPQPEPGGPGHTQSIFDQLSAKLKEKAASGDVAVPESPRSLAGDEASDESDSEEKKTPTASNPAEGYQLGSKESLESAQKKASLLNLMGGLSDTGSEFLNNMKSVGDMFTNKPSGVHFGNETGNALRSQGEAVTKNHQALVANQVNDPKSQASAEMRDLARQMGFPVSANVSAADMDKKFPGLSNIFSAREAAKSRASVAEENRKSRESVAKENRESRYDIAKLMAGNKKDAANEKTNDTLVGKMKDDLDPDKARGGNMAANQKQIYQADRLNQLYTEANGDLRNLDSRQMEELAIGVNKLLSGSSTGASHQIEALVPKTAVGNASKLAEWLSNDPQGTDQIKFVQRLSETVDREKAIAQQQVKAAQIKRLGAYGKLKENDPDRYGAILSAYGINSSDIDEKGQMKTTQPAAKSGSAPAVGSSVPVKAPDGTVRMIPKEKLQDAIAAGGQPVTQ